VEGWDWPASATVTITVEDSSTAQSPDLQTTAQCNDNGDFGADDLGGFDIKAGQVITVTDGVTVKELTVTALAVTGVDPDADTVTGTATAGSDVQVSVYDENGTQRETTASAGGFWNVDFTDAIGPEPWQHGYDIVPGSEGNAYQEDVDGDQTSDDWRVPRPVVVANPHYDWLGGRDWPASATVTITVEDSSTAQSPDLQTTAQCDIYGEFWAGDWDFDITPGQVITVTDGAASKTLTVTSIAVTGVDPSADTVSGTAAAGSAVGVSVYDENGTERDVTASTGGAWSADFTDAVGPEPSWQGYDIVPGSQGNAYQQDEDGDQTIDEWHVADYVAASGTTRYDTALATSRSSFETDSVETVVLATGADFPDALAAGPLAGAYNAPVLLTMPGGLPAGVAAEITRLGATDVVIVGGTGAVSPAVFNTLEAQLGAGHVTRIAGASRYQTAALVAEKINEVRPLDGTIFIATGMNYPDALAAGPDAWAQARPILLVKGATAPPETLAEIESLGADRAVVLGGTGAVSQAAANAVQAKLTGDQTVERIAGASRYDTAARVAAWSAAGEGLSWNTVGLATGGSFADALGGGPSVGKAGGVMLLTQSQTLSPPASAALTTHKLDIFTVRFYGGTGAVSTAVRNAAAAALK
jgi:putative cell wall-binding protein